jgi:hypothetical protein
MGKASKTPRLHVHMPSFFNFRSKSAGPAVFSEDSFSQVGHVELKEDSEDDEFSKVKDEEGLSHVLCNSDRSRLIDFSFCLITQSSLDPLFT